MPNSLLHGTASAGASLALCFGFASRQLTALPLSRLHREYETFNDLNRAKDAYERGMKLGDVTSTYRLGMAYLLGQLGLQPDINKGLDNLKTAAMIADQVADPDLAAPLYVCASSPFTRSSIVLG